jgi:anti-sigma factor ChrR (cupin superfamily)
MELNADFSRRAVVHAASLAWTPSPIAGVERRMLDRMGGEGGRGPALGR